MLRKYQYQSSIKYIDRLKFSYIETYSFQRGIAYDNNIAAIEKEYDYLKVRKDRGKQLTEMEKQRWKELDELLGSTQFLINQRGHFHPSSRKTNTFRADDPIATRLCNILRTEIRDIPRWMCAPTYRDAVVFYDEKNRIVSTLNVCLGCEYMATKMFRHIDGDFATYDLLKRFFIDIGHDVEDPTKFALDNISR